SSPGHTTVRTARRGVSRKRSMRVAIVNDMPLAREVLRRLVLSVPGYSVAWMATDGAEAVERAAGGPPDGPLVDLGRPGLDGVEATRQIMARCPCPILIVTASVGGNYPRVCEALACGGLDAVRTPVLGSDGQLHQAEELLEWMRRLGRE